MQFVCNQTNLHSSQPVRSTDCSFSEDTQQVHWWQFNKKMFSLKWKKIFICLTNTSMQSISLQFSHTIGLGQVAIREGALSLKEEIPTLAPLCTHTRASVLNRGIPVSREAAKAIKREELLCLPNKVSKISNNVLNQRLAASLHSSLVTPPRRERTRVIFLNLCPDRFCYKTLLNFSFISLSLSSGAADSDGEPHK